MKVTTVFGAGCALALLIGPALAGDPQQGAQMQNGQLPNEQAESSRAQALNDQGLTPEGEQGGNLDEAGRAQSSADQSSMPDQTATADQAMGELSDNTPPANVDTGAIARNEPVDPNVQRMQEAAEAKAKQMDNERTEKDQNKDTAAQNGADAE